MKGWHGQTVRHSNAKKYGKAGGLYAEGYSTKLELKDSKSSLTLSDRPKKIYDVEDLTDEQLSKLSEKQIRALKKGKPVKVKSLLEQARKEQIKDWETRYEILSKGEAVNEIELKKYREDRADYLQYLNEKKVTDSYLKSIEGTTQEQALQKLGEGMIKDLETESPTTVKFLRDNPEVKVHFVEEEHFKNYLHDRRGMEYLTARDINGIYYSVDNVIYVKVDIDKRDETRYNLQPRERAIVKEMLVHEVAHAQRNKNDWDDLKRELKTQVAPQLKDRYELFKRRGGLSKANYKSEVRNLDKKWGGFLTVPEPEYVAYHYQGRVRRRIQKPYLKQVVEQEKKGVYDLSFYDNEWGKRGLELPSIETRGG